MKRICLAVFLSVLSAGAAEARTDPCRPEEHAPVPRIKGRSYRSIRDKLIAAGWQPVQTQRSPIDDPDIAEGNGKIFWDKGFLEVEACAVNKTAPCLFLFKDKQGNKLRVTTLGEELSAEEHYATVNGYYFICR